MLFQECMCWKTTLAAFPATSTAMSVPLAPAPSIRTCWPSNCSGFLYTQNYQLCKWNSTTCNCDCESNFLHISQDPGFLEPQEQRSGHYKPWLDWWFSDTLLVQPYHNSLIWSGWSLPCLKLLGGHLPPLLAWNNSLHLKFHSHICYKSTAIALRRQLCQVCLFVHIHLVSGEYLSAELDVFMKKVGFCILLQVLQHLVQIWVWGAENYDAQLIFSTSEWWRNDFGWLENGKSGKAITYHDHSYECLEILHYILSWNDFCHLFWQVCCEVLIHARVPANPIRYNIEDRKGGVARQTSVPLYTESQDMLRIWPG